MKNMQQTPIQVGEYSFTILIEPNERLIKHGEPIPNDKIAMPVRVRIENEQIAACCEAEESS